MLSRDNNSFADSEVRDKYLSAIENIRKQDFNSAISKLIGIIRKDRNYEDDGARKTSIAIFKFLGEENEIT